MWREHKGPTWAPYTRRDQEIRDGAISADRIGSIPVARLSVADIDTWVGRLRKRGVGEGTIRNQLQALRSALAQAERWEWISRNPASLATTGRPKRVRRGVMTADDVRAVFAVAADVHEMVPALLRLAAITGARRAELAALQWTDLADGVLTIDSAISVVLEGTGADRRSVVRDDPTKTGDRRRLTLDAGTWAMLEELRARRAAVAPWLFSDTEKPPGPDRLTWWWKRCRDLAGIDGAWRLHDLRHWSATVALSAGHDLASVTNRLGHTDGSTTLRVYAHAMKNSDAALAASLASALDGAS